MKKLLFTLAATAIAHAATAQVEIGLKVSPGFSYFRADSPSPHDFRGDGGKLSFGGGIFMDYFFAENYAFNTGLFLTSKGGSYTYTELLQPNSPTSPLIPNRQKQHQSIQYLEIPATIELFTNEVAPATRLYFQIGGSLAFPVGATLNGDKYYYDYYTNSTQNKASDRVFALDANLLGSVGTEFQVGQSTKLLAGLSYHHGLINLDHYFEKDRGFQDVSIKNSVFALDLGIKF